MSELEGPFRSAEPTADAVREKEHEASFERVHDATTEAMRLERRRAARWRKVAWMAFAISIATAAIVGSLAMVDAALGPFVCLALAGVVSCGILAFHRREPRRP